MHAACIALRIRIALSVHGRCRQSLDGTGTHDTAAVLSLYQRTHAQTHKQHTTGMTVPVSNGEPARTYGPCHEHLIV